MDHVNEVTKITKVSILSDTILTELNLDPSKHFIQHAAIRPLDSISKRCFVDLHIYETINGK